MTRREQYRVLVIPLLVSSFKHRYRSRYPQRVEGRDRCTVETTLDAAYPSINRETDPWYFDASLFDASIDAVVVSFESYRYNTMK